MCSLQSLIPLKVTNECPNLRLNQTLPRKKNTLSNFFDQIQDHHTIFAATAFSLTDVEFNKIFQQADVQNWN